ncbi:MAG: DoxX family protein [Bacteroidia bacterium]
MKKINIIYWILTGLFAAFMLFTAIPDILVLPDAVKFMTDLGYPLYFTPFIGVAKVLGAIAIVIPGFPRIKEWAYAGLMFDLIGAMYSVSAKMGASSGLPILLFIAFGFCSYIFYHKKLKQTTAQNNQ